MFAVFAVFVAGCASKPAPAPPVPMRGDMAANTAQAKADTDRAFELIAQGQVAAAKNLLDRAIVADAMYGPAHNDLGLVYFAQGKDYEAAWAFERAAKLMPGRGEPQNNIGLVYERAERLADAESAYRSALELDASSTEFAGNLARVRVRRDERGDETTRLLQMLVLQDRRPAWADWARSQLHHAPASRPNG